MSDKNFSEKLANRLEGRTEQEQSAYLEEMEKVIDGAFDAVEADLRANHPEGLLHQEFRKELRNCYDQSGKLSTEMASYYQEYFQSLGLNVDLHKEIARMSESVYSEPEQEG